MKTGNFWGMILSFLCVVGFTGCGDDDEPGREITGYKEYVLTVASEKVPGVLSADGSEILTDVYAVKKSPADEWTSFGGIDGFDFEEDYECTLKVGETSYLDNSMGTPAWTEYNLLEVISKEKKNSENLPLHFIPHWYYESRFVPKYRYAIEADDKAIVEEDLKAHPIFPRASHCLIYAANWILINDAGDVLGRGVLKRKNKSHEEFPESYLLLKPEGNEVRGYMEWTFLDVSGGEAVFPSFDVFFTAGSKARMEYIPKLTPHLYHDLTAYYRNKYPEAGVKTVVVSFTLEM